LNVLMPNNIFSIKFLSRKISRAENFLYPPLKTFSDRLLKGFLTGCLPTDYDPEYKFQNTRRSYISKMGGSMRTR